MRRVVTALVLVMVAGSLAACGGAPDSGTTETPATPAAAGAPAGAAVVATATAVKADIYSPTQTVEPGKMFPSDPSSVPSAVIENLTAKKPMLVYFYDPTTKVASDQRREINSAIRKYRGDIELVTFDYTAGLVSEGTNLPLELNKAELMTGVLKVNTTPYIVLVDGSGRITYRFAGFVDRGLLEREVLRATQ